MNTCASDIQAAGRATIDNILDVTRKGRLAGNPRVIYKSSAVINTQDHIHGYPTILSEWAEQGERVARITKAKNFLKGLTACEPALATFDWAGAGMVLAGGSVESLLRYHRYINDFDIFILGDHDINARIAKLANHLTACWGTELTMRRAHTNLIFEAPIRKTDDREDTEAGHKPVQVILCPYEDLSAVLYSFDLGSSAVGWDGKSIWYSTAGLFAARYWANIVDLEARNASFEHRLCKYLHRGYGIIIPDLDPSTLPTAESGEVCSIGGILMRFGKYRNCRAEALKARCGCCVNPSSVHVPSSQSTAQYDGGDFPVQFESYTNARALTQHADAGAYLHASGTYNHSIPAVDLVPSLNREDLLRDLSTAVTNPRKINLAAATNILGDAIIARALVFDTHDGSLPEYAARVVDRRIAADQHRLVFPPVPTAIGTPTLFTAFPREPISAAAWYGKYYQVPEPTPLTTEEQLQAEVEALRALAASLQLALNAATKK